MGLDDLQVDPAGWTCGTGNPRTDLPVMWFKFNVVGSSVVEPPTTLVLPIARMQSIEIYAVKDGRAIAYQAHDKKSVRQGFAGPYVTAPLPKPDPAPDTYYVKIAGTGFPALLADIHLSPSSTHFGWPFSRVLLVTAIFGLVCAPFLLNITLFPILRQPFMLYHAGMSLGMMLALSAASGLATSTLPIDSTDLVSMTEIGYALIVGCGGFFAAHFLEDGAISTALRKLLIGSGLFVLLIAGGIGVGLPPFTSAGRAAYLLAFVPMCIASIAAMIQAIRRRSLWVRYQIVGWAPALIVGSDMVIAGLGMRSQTIFPAVAPFFAMGFEVLVTGIGVAHRLMLLRRERDDAKSEARVLENLSERDPMTGLYNRRALENRIETLHRSGHDTFALLDLDDFKQINDTAGHAVGDEVIRVTADVLKSDERSLAIRVGGEEFMVVMSGHDAAARAEQLRKAITLRVARELPGLNRLVTASMGLAHIPFDALPNSSFDDIFALVDTLLYDAKKAGRNRTVSRNLGPSRRRGQDRREQTG